MISIKYVFDYIFVYFSIWYSVDIMLLDTSAWIEFFKKTKEGNRVKDVLENENCQTSVTTLSEIFDVTSKYGYNPEQALIKVQNLSEIIALKNETSILAGKLNFERKKFNRDWGMMDSFVLATAILYNLKILTKDSDFKDLENAEML